MSFVHSMSLEGYIRLLSGWQFQSCSFANISVNVAHPRLPACAGPFGGRSRSSKPAMLAVVQMHKRTDHFLAGGPFSRHVTFRGWPFPCMAYHNVFWGCGLLSMTAIPLLSAAPRS